MMASMIDENTRSASLDINIEFEGPQSNLFYVLYFLTVCFVILAN